MITYKYDGKEVVEFEDGEESKKFESLEDLLCHHLKYLDELDHALGNYLDSFLENKELIALKKDIKSFMLEHFTAFLKIKKLKKKI